jgi:hypothetical protein
VRFCRASALLDIDPRQHCTPNPQCVEVSAVRCAKTFNTEWRFCNSAMVELVKSQGGNGSNPTLK